MSNQSVRVVIELDGGIVQKVVASAPVTYLMALRRLTTVKRDD